MTQEVEWGIEELACRACGKDEEETTEAINNSTVENLVYEKYEISLETYKEIVNDLIPFTPVMQTAIGNTVCHGFADGNNIIVKVEKK